MLQRLVGHGRAASLILGFAVAVGCGPSDIAYVSGSASHEGSPTPAGTKVFFELPGQGYLGVGVTQEDGAFTLKHRGSESLRSGDYVVFVGPPESDLSEAEFMQLKKKVEAEYRAKGKKPPRSPDWVLPEKFYSPRTSGLRRTVSPGENTIDLAFDP
ncbi:hypothetical protein MalM25_37730 [Planctomycetes bacterium MalM25]|nr:hypothetical protein MalM25_37730 [Planctomycetes bacterium MalM25]